MKLPEETATAIFLGAGLEPIAPYPGVDTPWRSVHLKCGRETSPTISNIRLGQGGCRHCGIQTLSDQFRMPEGHAIAVMRERGLEPLEPYPGSGRPWRSRHSCDREVAPTLSNIQQGKGICRYCFSPFPFDGPAEVYLVADNLALKVGISAPKSDRVPQHVRLGWELKWLLAVSTGDAAYTIEQGVIAWWRADLQARPAYGRDAMPQLGHTETARWGSVSASATLERALSLAADLGADAMPLSMAVDLDARPLGASSVLGPRARRTLAAAEQPPLF